MKKGEFVVVLIGGMLAGCISFPKSPTEFRAKAAGKSEFTADASLQDAYELVARNTIRCHQGDSNQISMIGGAFFVYPTGSTRVEGRIDPSSGVATITVTFFNMVGGGLLQVIDFARVDASHTMVVVHRTNDTKKWTSATESVKTWFSGSTECYDLW